MHDRYVVQQAVEDRGRQDLIPGEDLGPVAHVLIRGEHDRAPLIARRDQAEEEIRLGAIKWPEAHLVDDHERRVEVALGPQPRRRDGGVRPQDVHQVVEQEVRDGEAILHGFHPQGGRQVALADAGRAEEEHVGLFAHEAAGGEGFELAAIDAGLEAPVEALQGLAGGEPAELEHRSDAALVFALELAGADQVQEGERGELVARRFLDELGETARRVIEAERGELLGHRIQGDAGAAHRQAASTRATTRSNGSCTAGSGRSRSRSARSASATVVPVAGQRRRPWSSWARASSAVCRASKLSHSRVKRSANAARSVRTWRSTLPLSCPIAGRHGSTWKPHVWANRAKAGVSTAVGPAPAATPVFRLSIR